jgi:hypothetical protein
MQCFPVKSLVHKVLGGGGVYAYMRYMRYTKSALNEARDKRKVAVFIRGRIRDVHVKTMLAKEHKAKDP